VPDQPTWIERVPTILAFLESEDAPLFLDRPAVERLFGLRRRQAIELLRRCGGYQVGKTFLVLRETMVQFLNEPVTAAKVAVCFAQKTPRRRLLDGSLAPTIRSKNNAACVLKGLCPDLL